MDSIYRYTPVGSIGEEDEMQFTGVRLLINERQGGAPGFRVISEHPLLQDFYNLEEESIKDFSSTKRALEHYLNREYEAGAPHKVTFKPEDPELALAMGVIEVEIEIKAKKE
jgi:hypothetical protein